MRMPDVKKSRKFPHEITGWNLVFKLYLQTHNLLKNLSLRREEFCGGHNWIVLGSFSGIEGYNLIHWCLETSEGWKKSFLYVT